MTDRDASDLLAGYPEVLTGAEVAEILRIDPRTLAALAQSRQLPAFRAGTGVKAGWRFDKRRIVAVIEGRDPWEELPPLLEQFGPVLTAQEVATFLRYERATVAQMASAGALPGAFKISTARAQWRFNKHPLLELMEPPRPEATPDGAPPE
ncbi:helix-turn-helix domain-containing protein [Streptomyces sp. NPDC057681]|uniref:helix-turn-helix domain-containing protein n=1 Tax=Streptomyces sp. NPDC057681 TaxID=3346209 RepID=UPI0036B95403